MKTLLSTGDVARLLGSSRQHVVDMCERGDLPCVRVGTHRRVPEAAVRRLLATAHDTTLLTRDQERSLWLNRVVAARLMVAPDATMAKAKANLAAWQGVHRRDGMARHWLDEWARILDQGVDAVADTLTSRDPLAVELRQNSPFAGVLDEETRTQVLTAFRRHWRVDHATPAA
jgi:excisionase family DNA binding protein